MDDSDSSLTRKRPRLDSGDRSYRSMSADELSATPPHPKPARPPSTPILNSYGEAKIGVTDALSMPAPTPSKVTINVRDAGQGVSQPLPSVIDTSSTSPQQQYRATLANVSATGETPSPDVISVSSSPLRSPEIEVAEIEDMEDHPAETKWRSLREATDIQLTVLQQFPHHQQGRHLWRTIEVIVEALQCGRFPPGDRILKEVGDWIDLFLEATESLSSQWRQMFSEQKQFWSALPEIASCLWRGSNGFKHGDPPFNILVHNEEVDNRHDLQHFLLAFAALIARMVKLDCQILSGNSPNTNFIHELASDKYLRCLGTIIHLDRLAIGRLLRVSYGYENYRTITAVILRFVERPANGIESVSHLLQGLMRRSADVPSLLQQLKPPLNGVNYILQFYRSLKETAGFDFADLLDLIQPVHLKAYHLFEAADSTLQTFISKQMTALSHTVTETMVTHLASMLSSIVTSDHNIAATRLQKISNVSTLLKSQYGSSIIELTWKFHIFRKCFQEGRMEIRVQGVEMMQQELVNTLFNGFMSRDSSKWDHPVAQYIADLILEHKLVQYLVGVESHVQLISRCGNIFGFLAVTHRYTDAEIDAIWRAVRNSQDSRVVEAILQTINGVVPLAQYKALLYLTTKLNDLPLQNFDNNMLHYAKILLENLQNKWKFEERAAGTKMDMPPYNLCIRLIRQAAANECLAAQRQREIVVFATELLKILLVEGPSDADKESIFNECIEDISGARQFATGDLYAIIALINGHYQDGILSLASTYDLLSILVNDFATWVETGNRQELNDTMSFEQLTPRLNLIAYIIVHAPQIINQLCGQRLWDLMVGPQSLNEHARNRAWIMLAKVIEACHTRNPFIDQCINEYLPKLQPSYFATRQSLSFLEQVVKYESGARDRAIDDQGPHPRSSGIQVLWHVSIVVPPQSIELEAIGQLVSHYLNTPAGQNSPHRIMESIYIEVVERCISQLTAAALRLKVSRDISNGEDASIVTEVSEADLAAQRLSFTRSLLIMKEFVRSARARPTYSPLRQTVVGLPRDVHDVKGRPMNLPYQTFSGSASSGILRIDLGAEETVEDLSQRLQVLSKFADFTLIAGGRRLDLDADKHRTLEDMKIDQNTFLLVKKVLQKDSTDEGPIMPDLKPLEGEIMKHFATLYELLAMEDGLAKEVFEFLLTFPPHKSTTALVCAKDTPIDLVFPPKAPYQILYSNYALKSCLQYQLRNGTASQEFISHGVQLLANLVTNFELFSKSLSEEVDLVTALGLVDCLLAYLKEPIAAEYSMNYISSPTTFVDRLQSCVLSTTGYEDSVMSGELACRCFAVLLEASLHCENVWQYFKAAGQCAALLSKLILEDAREAIRQGTANCLRGVRAALPNLETTKSQEIEKFVWDQFQDLIPRSLTHAEHSRQFFEVMVPMFRSLDHMSRESLEVETLVKAWSDLLLVHKHNETIGSSNVDWVASGISCLLHCCIQVAKSCKKPLHIDFAITESLFRTCLFPVISYEIENAANSNPMPIIHSQTRHDLYQVIIALSNDIDSYRNLLRLISEILPQGEDSHAWSWGIAQISEESLYDTNWNLEKSRIVRSPTGYPGLRNLSNTCYLNSLFTQLFMNVSFRDFIMKTNITEGNRSQKLLAETKTLFAYMQETVLRSVDPQGIAESIVTYDGTQIDVAVQMDVDEFFNLLFDRWESQILSNDDKKSFRNFFGGQIVQQIKSKECTHISERLEPFSAIQCDIQGKATLKESLDAYVSGEDMEGDNKYSCTSCGRYVDAVKRACLKDVPDNLIFHLKRFDYDLMSGTRNKINDRFEFPHEINMTPYNVTTLMGPDEPAHPDVFELVGVLVHTGTAESGHYYSYIRERPVDPANNETWVEYNDADIIPFDHMQIPDQCYGGMNDAAPFQPYPKPWNAYMLFYQRKKAMTSDLATYRPCTSGLPVKVELPVTLLDRIALDNAHFTRKYCLLDESYATFASDLLEQLGNIKKGICTQGHLIERDSIWLALTALDQVFSRVKDSFSFDKMLGSLTRVIGGCTTCCKIALEWVASDEANLKNMLLRCPSSKIRKEFGTMIMIALRYLREQDPTAYGLAPDHEADGSTGDNLSEAPGAFHSILSSLRELRRYIPAHSRAWDDYFGLLAEMAATGSVETYILIREGFVQTCLEFLTADSPEVRQQENNSHVRQYWRLIEKGRKFSLHKLIELLRILLEQIDFVEEAVELDEYSDRPILNGKARLSLFEDEYLRLGSRGHRTRTIVFLEKVIASDNNRTAADSIVRTMLLSEPDEAHLAAIQQAIFNGINIEPATLAASSLTAALTYCEFCPENAYIKELIKLIALEVDTIGMNGGHEHLDFFSLARRLSNMQVPKNQPSFHRLVLLTAPNWAPALLMYWDESVRIKAVDLLKTLMFDCDTRNMDNEREANDVEKVGRDLCEACTKRIEETYVKSGKTVEAKMVDQVIQIVRACTRNYCDVEEVYRPIAARADLTIDRLQTLTVSEAYDAVSEGWNDDNSTNPTDSESEQHYLSGGL